MIIFDVGTKITDIQLRLLILKSSTGGVSFDIMNSVVFLSLHVNFSCKIVHTLWNIYTETTIYLALFQALQLVLDCANASWFVQLDPACQNSCKHVPSPQQHIMHPGHQTPQQHQSYHCWLEKYAYFHSLSSAFWLAFSASDVNDQ